MTSAKDLFDDFCYYRQRTAYVQKLRQERPYIRDLKETPARLKLFAHMAKWCADRRINPREWLCALFVTRRWLFAPKLERGHLQSEKQISRFRKLPGYCFQVYRQRLKEQASFRAMDSETVFDPNRDISHAAEEAKRRYLQSNDAKTCMDKTKTETFGFHPKSSVCARCPERELCKASLVRSVRFDILALRRGEITSKEARSTALIRAQSYGD